MQKWHWKLFVPFFHLYSAHLLLEIRFVVRKFVKSYNDKSFFLKFMDQAKGESINFQKKKNSTNNFQLWTQQASSITYISFQSQPCTWHLICWRAELVNLILKASVFWISVEWVGTWIESVNPTIMWVSLWRFLFVCLLSRKNRVDLLNSSKSLLFLTVKSYCWRKTK